MGDIWDNLDQAGYEDDNSNRYLNDLNTGYNLIKSILPSISDKKIYKNYKSSFRFLDKKKLANLFKFIDIDNSLEIAQKLIQLCEQLEDINTLKILGQRKIIGIGGQFSAGKSCFINSLLGDNTKGILLPEDQTPTTSIATYIIEGKEGLIHAYTQNKIVELDKDALQAITHEFYRKHHIGFSSLINHIVIQTTAFPNSLQDKIAFLDTPGYNKSDFNITNKVTDYFVATEQLKRADCLIWLMDIDNGTINTSDLDFLHAIGNTLPVLFVFNKADKKSLRDCQSIVEECKQVLNKYPINVYDVIAYSATEKKVYIGDNAIDKYLQLVIAKNISKNNIPLQLKQLLDSLDRKFKQALNNAKADRNNIGESLGDADDILSIRYLSERYSSSMKKIAMISKGIKEFESIKTSILESVTSFEKWRRVDE